MGLFGFGKNDPEIIGDHWYKKSLRATDRKLEYLRKSASLGSRFPFSISAGNKFSSALPPIIFTFPTAI